MLRSITDIKDFNIILRNIDFISLSQDKRKFLKDLLGRITYCYKLKKT